MKTLSIVIVMAAVLFFEYTAFAQTYCGTCRQNYYETVRIIDLMKPQAAMVRDGYRGGNLAIHANAKTVSDLRKCVRNTCSGSNLDKALTNINWIARHLRIYSGQKRVLAVD